MDLFNPFSSTKPKHENRLTWSFLTMLKYDMYLQKYIYDAVTTQFPQFPQLPAIHNTWEPAHISMETSRIDESIQPQQLVSVLLTDEKIQNKIKVKWIERDARYDGVISYPNGLTLIVENKLDHGNVWEEQLSPSQNAISDNCREIVSLHDLAICLEWPDILEAVLKYSDSEIASFGNRNIARDFLSFTEKFHPNLTPYRTYILCGNRESALNRRTVCLVDTVAKKSGLEVHNRYNYCLDRPDGIARIIAFQIVINSNRNTWNLRIDLWPASTASQAYNFCESLNRSEFLNLDESKWIVTPNLNFSFRGTKLYYPTNDWNSESYMEYFFGQEIRYGRNNSSELEELLELWSENGLIRCEDTLKIKQIFQNRKFFDINPEFSVYREFNSEIVIRMESQDRLEKYIIESLAVPLATWGEDLRVLG